MTETVPHDLSDILGLIQPAHQKLEEALARCLPAYLEESGKEGEWSIKDILAHITDWEGRMLSWLSQAIAGEVPSVPQNWDEIHRLNNTAYLMNRERKLQDVQDAFQISYQKVISFLRTIDNEDIFDLERYPWRGDNPLWHMIAANTWWHYDEHTEEILRRSGSPGVSFRQVLLDPKIPGKLFLHSMPGSAEVFLDFTREAQRQGIHRLVCLTGLAEIRKKSPEYANAIESNSLPWQIEMLSIPDFGVPEDRSAFSALASQVASWLKNSENVLVHCGAGIGRTGTLAIAGLLYLGVSLQEAYQIVRSAGSQPETTEQKALLTWLSVELLENRINT